jgi:hypothetical protein
MGKALVIFSMGLALLFTFSLTFGLKVFSAVDRRLAEESRLEKSGPPDLLGLAERESRLKKIKLAMNPFDLTNGLTLQEIENIPLQQNYSFSALLSLLAGLGVVWALREFRNPS